MPYSLVIFDCDGTLVDSEYLNIKAIIALLGDFGISGYDVDYGLKNFSGHSFRNILGMITEETGFKFPDNVVELYIEEIDAISGETIEKIDAVENMVKSAKSLAKICVASNGEMQNVLTSLNWAELRHYFNDEDIFTGAMVDAPKPAPDLFILAAEKMDVPANKCLVIEDSIAGVIAAKAANMAVWGFCATHHDPKAHAANLIENGADKTFETMIDMEEELRQLF